MIEFTLSNEGARALVNELTDFLEFEAERLTARESTSPTKGYVAARMLRDKIQKVVAEQEAHWAQVERIRRLRERPTVREQYNESEDQEG